MQKNINDDWLIIDLERDITMNVEELVLTVLPILGLAAVTILMIKRPKAFSKKGYIGVICGSIFLLLYYR